MSEIVKALKDDTQEFYINDHDRIALTELLTCVGAALMSGKLWFNRPGIKNQAAYISLCERLSKRFANMPVHEEV